MNKLAVEVYETPRCSVVELCTEGVFCQSGSNGNFAHDGFEDGDNTGESIF